MLKRIAISAALTVGGLASARALFFSDPRAPRTAAAPPAVAAAPTPTHPPDPPPPRPPSAPIAAPKRMAQMVSAAPERAELGSWLEDYFSRIDWTDSAQLTRAFETLERVAARDERSRAWVASFLSSEAIKQVVQTPEDGQTLRLFVDFYLKTIDDDASRRKLLSLLRNEIQDPSAGAYFDDVFYRIAGRAPTAEDLAIALRDE